MTQGSLRKVGLNTDREIPDRRNIASEWRTVGMADLFIYRKGPPFRTMGFNVRNGGPSEWREVTGVSTCNGIITHDLDVIDTQTDPHAQTQLHTSTL